MRFSIEPVNAVNGESILSLTSAKAHLRVQHDFEDDLIASFRDTALDSVEQFTGKSLTATRQFIWRGYFGENMCLGITPKATITSIKYNDAAGVEQNPVVQNFVRIKDGDKLYPLSDKAWPETQEGDGAVEIAFSAGYTQGACPPSLLHAARLLLGTYYANREAVVVGVSTINLPMGFIHLCQPYRRLRV